MADGDRIRVGVIGLGLIAQAVHLPNLATLRDRFSVRHVCDLSGELAAAIADALPGDVRASRDWRAVCDDPDLDAILVLTPGDHAPTVGVALDRGRHVLVEKPLCVTIAEARDLERRAASAGVVLQVGYMKMYDPIVRFARDALARLGTRRVVRVTVLHPADAPQFEHHRLRRGSDVDAAAIAAADTYELERTAEALGDAPLGIRELYRLPLLGSVCHELSLLRALGIPLPASFEAARAWPFEPSSRPDAPPSIHAVADLGDGSILELTWAWLPDYPDYVEEVAVFGTAGRLRLDMPGPYLPAHRATLSVDLFEGERRDTTTSRASHVTAFVRELEAFADSIERGAPVLSDAAGSAADLACLQQLAVAVGRGLGVDIHPEATR